MHCSSVNFVSARIVTRDVPALARFYEALCGVAPVGCDDYVEFEFGAAALAICSQRCAELFNAGAAVPAANRSIVIEFEVSDVDAERRRLAPFVGGFEMEPADQPWGNRSMLFRDPDGNLINFYAQVAGRR
jgi:predicted enzyme related to lactoylglutathione lyase